MSCRGAACQHSAVFRRSAPSRGELAVVGPPGSVLDFNSYVTRALTTVNLPHRVAPRVAQLFDHAVEMRKCRDAVAVEAPLVNDAEVGWLTLNEGGDHLLDADGSLDRIRAAAGEIDPSFVEPIQHTNARTRVFHPLRAEQILPGSAGHNFGSHGRSQDLCKGGRQVVGRDSARTFQLDDSRARPNPPE
jgi:hypothetical protein